MRWDTVVELRCGCRTRFEQIGYATPLPDPGDDWTCPTHGDTEIKQSSRVGK
jgi:hypothetical protein